MSAWAEGVCRGAPTNSYGRAGFLQVLRPPFEARKRGLDGQKQWLAIVGNHSVKLRETAQRRLPANVRRGTLASKKRRPSTDTPKA